MTTGKSKATDGALAACPFCGCTDVSNNDDGDHEWFECDWCHATSGFDPAPEFDGLPPSFHWNRRAAESPDAMIEALRFYADHENWVDTPSWDSDPTCITPKAIPVAKEEGQQICDCGDKARAALALRIRSSLAALPPPTGEPVAWEFLAADGSWKPCRNERDAAMWAEDGRKIRPVPGTIR